MMRPPPMPNRPAQKPDAIPLNPNTANMSVVLMEISLLPGRSERRLLAGLVKAIKFIRHEICDEQHNNLLSLHSVLPIAIMRTVMSVTSRAGWKRLLFCKQSLEESRKFSRSTRNKGHPPTHRRRDGKVPLGDKLPRSNSPTM
jgi:hypothetical protein